MENLNESDVAYKNITYPVAEWLLCNRGDLPEFVG
jgi:hypothetical protein